ncbi:MAG: D-alanine--D-alanine ligase, partial [Brevinematia bacterium]
MIDFQPELERFKSKRIGVLAGGLSSEREISIRSGTNVFNVIKTLGFDCIMIDVDKNVPQKLIEEKIDIAVI